MDIARLLSGFRCAEATDFEKKGSALHDAFVRFIAFAPDATCENFLDQIPDQLLSSVYGDSSEDFYFTSLFAIASQVKRDFDCLFTSVLSHIVLSLNFQTRIYVNGRPEAVLFSGGHTTLQIGMIGSNVVNGILVCNGDQDPTLKQPFPSKLQDTHLRKDAIIESTPTEIVEALDGRLIGCLAIDLTDLYNQPPETSSWMVACRHQLTCHTVYVVNGSTGTIFKIARQLSIEQPDAKLYTRVNGRKGNGWHQTGAILVATGLKGLPDALFRTRHYFPCRFRGSADLINTQNPEVEIINFSRNTKQNTLEETTPKKPFAVVSSAPLPEEVRHRVSDTHYTEHSVAIIDKGILIPHYNIDHTALTFLNATGSGNIVEDYGDLRENHIATTVYKDGYVDEAGICHSRVESKLEVIVDGPAMPLLFTPNLHLWHSHFLMQCLPRITILKDIGIDAKLIVPMDLRRKQKEMLAAVGYGAERLVPVPRNALVRTGQLIVPRPWPLIFSEYTIRIYDEILQNVGYISMSPKRRILISREQRTGWRNLLTYPAIKHLLVSQFKFEVIRPEELSLRDEIAAYRSAEILIGAEGAGMYGACFAQSDTTVISICDEDYAMPTLGTLATLRGFKIGYIFGESMRSDADVKRRRSSGHCDFMVDPSLVSTMLEQIIESQPAPSLCDPAF